LIQLSKLCYDEISLSDCIWSSVILVVLYVVFCAIEYDVDVDVCSGFVAFWWVVCSVVVVRWIFVEDQVAPKKLISCTGTGTRTDFLRFKRILQASSFKWISLDTLSKSS
jgi:hypothetical protein